jgi:tetratricopeptide (TPR) repeat protein
MAVGEADLTAEDGRTHVVDARGAVGVQVGDHSQLHLHLTTRTPPWWTRSGYIEQVRDIAPDGGLPSGLRDRAGELAELATFCTGDEAYLWWKAEPWAGKSALLATFVLNPPPGAEVVAFFITARLAAQGDSAAFTDALLDQLSAIVGEQVPASLPPTARDAHRRALLRAAADQVVDQGRRLVLVVDGLDEDRGGRYGSGLASVASLLPKICHDNMRIVIASRPTPELPDDVPADHPLRRCRIRELSPSPHATELSRRATRELGELLHGDQAHRDVLGLITACGGGLTLPELEELTGLPLYQLDDLLGGVFGRTITGRSDGSGGSSHRLYLFTHETLRETAVKQFGSALDGYREQLFAWAGRYQRQGWPAETPQYLLRGYARMLQARHDVDRLAELATDPDRHDRMLDLTGGDAAALTEIRNCQSLILDLGQPDLYTLACLSRYRNHLEIRNNNIPTTLPAVWAILGQLTRAEALARGFTDPYQRTRALARLARAVAAAGEHDRARTLTTEAERISRSVTDPDQRTWALTGLAQAMATVGEYHRAEQIARDITEPDLRAWALAGLAKAMAAAGEYDRAESLTTDAERIGRGITSPYRLARALAGLAQAIAAGEQSRARTLTTEAERIGRGITDPHQQARVLADVAEAVAAAGEYDRAERIARAVTDPYRQARALAGLAQALAVAGEHDRARTLTTDAERIARDLTDPYRQARALADVAQAIAATGEHGQAERLARAITDLDLQARALADVAQALAAAGEHDRARTLTAQAGRMIQRITSPYQQARAQGRLAGAVAAVGEHDHAVQIARDITNPAHQAQTMTDLADVIGLPGAGPLLGEAFAIGSWLGPLPVLAKLYPALMVRIADSAQVGNNS